MREIKIKDYSKQEKKWILIKLFENTSETLSEFINLYDYNGQELFTNDLVIIENDIISKQFRVVFSQDKLAYGFQTEDQAKIFYTLHEIKGIFQKFTITKVGNIFNF